MAIDWTEIFEKYKGKWVALKDDEKTVVGNGTSAKAALEDARNNGYADPILFRMPEKIMSFAGQSDEVSL